MEKMTPIKSIRAKCLDCMCGNTAEVRRCPCKDCALYPYRMGHRPKKNEGGMEIPEDEENAENPTVVGSTDE